DLQRRRGGGVRERRSPRRSPNTDDAPSSARRRRRESHGFAAGDIGAGDDGDAPPVGGKSSTLAAAIDGQSSSQGSLGRNGADDARAAAAAAAAAAAPGSEAAVAAAAAATYRARDGMADSDNDDACRSLGLPSPSPPPPPPPQKRGRKRSRAPPPFASAALEAAEAAAEAAEAPSSPSSSSAALEPPMPTARRRAAKTQRQQHRPPFVVTPLTNDGDEPEGRQGAEVAKGTTSVAASVASTAGAADAGDFAAAGASASLACVSPSRGASTARGRSWPTAARVASLNFSRGGAWRVSSVTVAVGDGRCSNLEKKRSASAGTAAAAAVVVVCHSGGVSVWHLTDAEALCRYVSPALASGGKESARGRFFVAAVVGGGGDDTEVTPSAARMPRRTGICIVAIGRHEADPGLPVIRVWQGSPRREGRLGNKDIPREKTAVGVGAPPPPPAVLTTTVKKKISSYFPPVVPRHVAPCLCVCGYSTTDNPDAGAGGGRGGGEGEGEVELEVEVEDVTAVMALGGKVVRLICAAARSGSEDVKAKSLPAGSVGSGAVCTSLAPVPTNPFLVWASFPSSNAVLLWDVRELQLLFTLPLTSSSVCVPTMASLWPLTVRSRGEGPSSSSLSSPSQLRRPRGAQRDPRLLCLLATGSSGGDGFSGGGGRGGSGGDAPTRPGCGLFGVCRAGSDGGEGAVGCSSSISAIRLEAVAGDEESPRPERLGTEHENNEQACLNCLCEGDGFVAGADKQGRVVARDLLTGEPHVLFTAETANNTRGGGGAVAASMDCD
ncbi:unnamed protein product, partial [Laminaria digitata]